MKKHTYGSLRVLFIFVFLVFAASVPSSHAQLILGQYEDEAPFRTWNTLGVSTAAALGRGEAQFATASDCSAALSNPALLAHLPGMTFTLSASYNTATFFKFSVVNTGILFSDKNLPAGFYATDFAGTSLSFKGWTLALSSSLLESYDRPQVESQYTYEGKIYHTLKLKQSGLLRNINVALARKLGRGISIGVGINWISGDYEKKVIEDWVADNITITDEKTHNFNGFSINGGLVWNVSEKLAIGAIVRGPFTKKATSHSLLRYAVPQGNPDITIEANEESLYEQPLVLGAGFNFEVFDNFFVASDMSFFNWSRYKINYFGEEITRDFKDIVKISGGFEYWGSLRLFNRNLKSVLRGGISLDPQPMNIPDSRYLSFSFGSGIRWGRIQMDIAALMGRENGSGNTLSGKKFVVTFGFQ